VINIELLIAEYNDGSSYEEIGRAHNKSTAWVYKRLNGHVTSRPVIRKAVKHKIISWSTIVERNQLAIDLYRSGVNVYVISKRLQIAKKTIFRILSSIRIKRTQTNSSNSRLETQVATILNNLGIKYNTQFVLDGFRYDFGLNNNSVLIEVQGSYWHTLPQRRQRDAKKASLAYKNNRKLIVIWDHELHKPELVKSRILHALKPIKFDFHKCIVKEIDWKIAKDQLDLYHHQGAGRRGLSIAATIDNIPIATIVFTARSNNKEVIELIRLVINPEYQAKNFATWFISRAIKLLKLYNKSVKLLVSFADPTFGHNGGVYRAAGWKFDGTTSASYWYFNSRLKSTIHKKTIWDAAKMLNIDESSYAKQKHLIKVYGQRKLRFTFSVK